VAGQEDIGILMQATTSAPNIVF